MVSFAQPNGNYVVIINNDSIPINLDSNYNYNTEKGEQLTIKVFQPEILTYSDSVISFKHHKSLSVSNTVIEDGIEQCMMIKSTGNGIMVQKYKTMNPSYLTEIMLNELTKESVSYGYKKTEKKFKKKLKSGQTIKGVMATLIYKGAKEVYTVASYGSKDEGILVVTMLLNDDFKEDKKIIKLFLNTLSINSK